MKKIRLGCIAKDRITGFQGVVVGHTRHLSNIDRWTLHPRAVKDGKPAAGFSFDEGLLEYVDASDLRVTPIVRGADAVQLGDTVRLDISGLEGVVVSITDWCEGCTTLMVQPRDLHEGKPAEQAGTDERSVQIVTRANPPKAPVKTGGPRAEPVRARQ